MSLKLIQLEKLQNTNEYAQSEFDVYRKSSHVTGHDHN